MLGRTGGSARLRGALIQVCALRDVSPRDRRLCVLPGWQMNVNVEREPSFTPTFETCEVQHFFFTCG